MASKNLVILIGNLGRDPEIRHTQSDKTVTTFAIATKDSYEGRDGKKQESTDWHNIVAWGRLAEICGEYLRKGSLVYVGGKLKTRIWEDKDKVKRYITEVVISEMQMLDSRKEGSPF